MAPSMLSDEGERSKSGVTRPRLRLPRMSKAEIALLQAAAGRSRYVSEFGVGGSSSLFLRSGVETLVSVESDAAWVEMMRNEPDVRAALDTGRMHMVHVELGPVRSWGYPATRDRAHLWGSYPRAPWGVWQAIGRIPDLILVDGRFRVACCARTAEFLMQSAMTGEARILMHDMIPKRVGYRQIFDFMEEVESVESLFLLKCRPDVSMSALQALAAVAEQEPQ